MRVLDQYQRGTGPDRISSTPQSLPSTQSSVDSNPDPNLISSVLPVTQRLHYTTATLWSTENHPPPKLKQT